MSRVVTISFPFLARSSLQGICIARPAEGRLEYCSGLSPRCKEPCQIVFRSGSSAEALAMQQATAISRAKQVAFMVGLPLRFGLNRRAFLKNILCSQLS